MKIQAALGSSDGKVSYVPIRAACPNHDGNSYYRDPIFYDVGTKDEDRQKPCESGSLRCRAQGAACMRLRGTSQSLQFPKGPMYFYSRL